MFRPVLISLYLPLAGWSATAAPATRVAPNLAAVPVNQLCVSGNACGPASLLNAFQAGNKDWQRASDAVVGTNDKERILRIIREIGMRPSKHTPGRPRWSRRGVSLADLADMANEMTIGRFLPQIVTEVFFLKPRETPEQLLQRVHHRLDKSLAKGLPPVVSLRRYVLRSQSGAAPQWVVIEAHFVTIVSATAPAGNSARSFSVGYVDPWGGKRCEGVIAIPLDPVLADSTGHSTCVVADFPKANVGKALVRKGEKSVLVASAALGRW